MKFEEALAKMKEGKCISRELWSDKGMYVRIHRTPKKLNIMPYFTLKTSHGKVVPWLPNHIDLLAEDYIEVEFKPAE
jgi:hypothetical protein